MGTRLARRGGRRGRLELGGSLHVSATFLLLWLAPVARLVEQGHPALYDENLEGGHGGAADIPTFLWQVLAGGPARD